MIELKKKTECCGCFSCYNVCPKDAIKMIEDKEGFKYPIIDKEKCVDCGLCEKTCPCLNSNKKDKLENDFPKVFAGWSNDEYVRLDSTSGGIFTELANVIYSENGYVCGAIYNKEWLVEHYLSNNSSDIDSLRSSKYLQSDINDIFRQIKEKLIKGKKVLFCGSPCQVVGLKNYLQHDYENLVLVDFICRGMNSPKIFKGYINNLEKKYSSKVKMIKFKNKTYGWHNFSTKIDFENGKTYIKGRYLDSYMIGYLKYNAFMRPSCYECKFKCEYHNSDLTIADFWGIEKIDSTLDQDKGTSMILVNSQKGLDVFNKITPNINCKEIFSEKVFKENVCIKKSVQITDARNNVFENIDKMEYSELSKSFFPEPNLLKKIKLNIKTNNKIYNFIKENIIKSIRK